MKSLVLVALTYLFSQNALADYVIETEVKKASKSGSVEYIHVGSSQVDFIGIINLDNTTEVLEVEVVTNSGSYDLYELERTMYGRDSVSTRINPYDYVEYIVVRTISPNLFGSRGRYVVQLVVDSYNTYDRFYYRNYWRVPHLRRAWRPIYRYDRYHHYDRLRDRYRRHPRHIDPQRPRHRRPVVRHPRHDQPPPVRQRPDRRRPHTRPAPGRSHPATGAPRTDRPERRVVPPRPAERRDRADRPTRNDRQDRVQRDRGNRDQRGDRPRNGRRDRNPPQKR